MMTRKLHLASVPRIAAAAIVIAAAATFCLLELTGNPAGQVLNPPEVHAKHHTLSLTLHAAVASDGKNSFYFDGQPTAPTLRVSPGDQLKITCINARRGGSTWKTIHKTT
jgi:FtsP/CotA-like multicopper oxidase with cupredoxin domain